MKLGPMEWKKGKLVLVIHKDIQARTLQEYNTKKYRLIESLEKRGFVVNVDQEGSEQF